MLLRKFAIGSATAILGAVGALTALPAVADAATIPGTPCSTTAKACVDISAKKAWLIKNGKVAFGPVAIGPGKAGSRTPTGTFRVLNKVQNYYSKEFHAPMPYSVFFYPGDAFHVGNPAVASNGCVHLHRPTAIRFFNYLNKGDQVQIKP